MSEVGPEGGPLLSVDVMQHVHIVNREEPAVETTSHPRYPPYFLRLSRPGTCREKTSVCDTNF